MAALALAEHDRSPASAATGTSIDHLRPGHPARNTQTTSTWCMAIRPPSALRYRNATIGLLEEQQAQIKPLDCPESSCFARVWPANYGFRLFQGMSPAAADPGRGYCASRGVGLGSQIPERVAQQILRGEGHAASMSTVISVQVDAPETCGGFMLRRDRRTESATAVCAVLASLPSTARALTRTIRAVASCFAADAFGRARTRLYPDSDPAWTGSTMPIPVGSGCGVVGLVINERAY